MTVVHSKKYDRSFLTRKNMTVFYSMDDVLLSGLIDIDDLDFTHESKIGRLGGWRVAGGLIDLLIG